MTRMFEKRIITQQKIFLAKRSFPVLIDEDQKVLKIFDACKARIDRKRIPGQFFLTGSTQFSERIGIRESLTGRIGMTHFYPLTLSEANEQQFRQLTSLIEPIQSKQLRFSPEDIAQAL